MYRIIVSISIVTALGECAVEIQEATTQVSIDRSRTVEARKRGGPTTRMSCKLAAVCANFELPASVSCTRICIGAERSLVVQRPLFRGRRETASNQPMHGMNCSWRQCSLLAKRKEDFRETFSSSMTEYQRELSQGEVFANRRCTLLSSLRPHTMIAIRRVAVFESSSGEQFVIVSATDRASAADIAAAIGSGNNASGRSSRSGASLPNRGSMRIRNSGNPLLFLDGVPYSVPCEVG